jgi:mRNA-degrading endonuclease toxin of MazEF toxin-antitoxin module
MSTLCTTSPLWWLHGVWLESVTVSLLKIRTVGETRPVVILSACHVLALVCICVCVCSRARGGSVTAHAHNTVTECYSCLTCIDPLQIAHVSCVRACN